MQSSALIRYRIHRLNADLMLEDNVAEALLRIEKLEKDLEVAHRRELLALCAVLNYKADVYYGTAGGKPCPFPTLPPGRIYPVPGQPFSVGTSESGSTLFYGNTRLDPNLITDGHGSLITPDSSL
jgi:hypothetical protein